MDKEELEKIHNELRAIHTPDWVAFIEAVFEVMEAIGYRKLPKDTPPVLDKDTDSGAVYKGKCDQREADIKWYEGE